MNGIDLIDKLAEMQRQYADAHRPVRSLEQYREPRARRHPECNCAANGMFRSIRPDSESTLFAVLSYAQA